MISFISLALYEKVCYNSFLLERNIIYLTTSYLPTQQSKNSNKKKKKRRIAYAEHRAMLPNKHENSNDSS